MGAGQMGRAKEHAFVHGSGGQDRDAGLRKLHSIPVLGRPVGDWLENGKLLGRLMGA